MENVNGEHDMKRLIVGMTSSPAIFHKVVRVKLGPRAYLHIPRRGPCFYVPFVLYIDPFEIELPSGALS